MRQVTDHRLWWGNAGELRDLRAVLAAGIEAVVELAAEEPLQSLTRDLICCRFPLIDGAGNPDWLIRLAIRTVTDLLSAQVPTLVVCGAGMSRSPSIVAAAISQETGEPIHDILQRCLSGGPSDVSPQLLADVERTLRRV